MMYDEVKRRLASGELLQNLTLKVTYYSRVSTDHLEQKSSLINQNEFFEDYIKGNKNWKFIDGYIDEGISGATDYKRENFMKMINDASLGLFDLIITKEISRFSRNTLDSIKYVRKLKDYGVIVYFINDNINTASPDAELRLTIMASLAQDELRRLSERIKFGMNRSISVGKILGNDTLYGYKKCNSSLSLRIDKEKSKIVNEIFNMYVYEKYSLNKIVKILNKNNIKTSLNNKFSVTTISRMIENPKYKGYYCGNKSEVINYITKKVKRRNFSEWSMYKDVINIPPIINEELWNKANKRLKSRKFKLNKKNISYGKHIFSGKLICGNDNKYFYRRKKSKKSNKYFWICSKRLNEGKEKCLSPVLDELMMLNITKNIISKLGFNKKIIISKLLNIYKNKELKIYIEKIINNDEINTLIIDYFIKSMIIKSLEDENIYLEIYIKNNTKIFYVTLTSNKLTKSPVPEIKALDNDAKSIL